jgi:hypothetical protein
MSELSEQNYRRINYINWALTVPMMVIFAWPYYQASTLLGIKDLFTYPGSFVFALAFMITILHGHVTMALGAVHRDYYYDWLENNPLSFGLFFHRLIVTTRFRITMFISSLLIFLIGYLTAVI